MKLALVHLNRRDPDPPLGLAYIAAYIRKYGGFRDIAIVDKEDHMKRLKKEKPDVVGISSLTHEFAEAKALASEIKKELDVPLIIGGYHVSLLPHHFNDTDFDIAVIREGEQTMLELMQLFEREAFFPKKGLEKIRGIIYREGSAVRATEPRPLIENLDDIPYPARDLLRMEDYYMTPRISTFGRLGIYLPMLTSRGCPYKCVFCCNTQYWQRIRFNSPEYVVGEMKLLAEKYKADGIIVFDDLFIADKERVRKIAGLMEREGIAEKAGLHVYARANLVNDEICNTLKKMNAKIVEFGLESGSERILKYLKTGNVTVADNRNALALCKKYGFKTAGSFITGAPGETEQDLMETESLIQDTNLDIAHVYQLIPLPGTKIWEEAKRRGFISENSSSDYGKLLMRAFNPKMVMSDVAPERYAQIFRQLYAECEKKRYRFDAKNLFSQIRPKHIKYFLKPRFMKKVKSHWRLGLSYVKNSIVG